MKKPMTFIANAILSMILCAGAIAAQDAKKMKMDMADMKNDPHHSVMMAYRHNMMTFAKVLREMTKDGKLADLELARGAFSEIKRSLERMDAIHQSHMDKMSPEMRAMMKPMMEKMQAEKALVNKHVTGLETALGAVSPDAGLIYRHASELVLQLQKMDKGDKKMKM
jgi:hypothetical protein